MNPPVLVVDDDRDAREVLCLRLSHAGIQSATAGDARQAIAQFQSVRPRVVLLDASMPGLSGFDVSRFIKEQDVGGDVSVVFLSGASSPTLEYVRRCAELSGADRFITKPYDGAAVVELVTQLLRDGPPPGGAFAAAQREPP